MITSHQLRLRRLHLGLSREQLAHTLGVAIDEVADWEEGTAPIACPVAVEHVLRKREDSVRDIRAKDEAAAF